ncbi:MAG: hypothetical protein EOO41_00960 [Methanobacteriota archaeon]|nr:MAG: hypothetical protein EOO41_00960 [Euryarchaeota archaeon]
MRWTLLATGAVAGTYYAATHREELAAAAQGARASIVEFYVEHLQIPLQQMSSELFGGKRAQVADAAALVESKRDLVAMLQHYYGRIGSSAALRTSLSSDLQAADLARLAATMDMRGVGERFVIEVRQPISNAVRGDLVELMLIQIAYIKKELLAAMAAMDQVRVPPPPPLCLHVPLTIPFCAYVRVLLCAWMCVCG